MKTSVQGKRSLKEIANPINLYLYDYYDTSTYDIIGCDLNTFIDHCVNGLSMEDWINGRTIRRTKFHNVNERFNAMPINCILSEVNKWNTIAGERISNKILKKVIDILKEYDKTINTFFDTIAKKDSWDWDEYIKLEELFRKDGDKVSVDIRMALLDYDILKADDIDRDLLSEFLTILQKFVYIAKEDFDYAPEKIPSTIITYTNIHGVNVSELEFLQTPFIIFDWYAIEMVLRRIYLEYNKNDIKKYTKQNASEEVSNSGISPLLDENLTK